MTILMETSLYTVDSGRKYRKVPKAFVWRKYEIGCRRRNETLAGALQSAERL